MCSDFQDFEYIFYRIHKFDYDFRNGFCPHKYLDNQK